MKIKVSIQVSRATNTANHNDRSMYEDGKMNNEFEKDEHPNNRHWDCYNCGSSVEAEKKFYENNFRAYLDKRNRRYVKDGKANKVWTMEEYRKKNMPWEMVFQLGNIQEQPDNYDYINDVIDIITMHMQYSGLDMISYDVHFDEATPHIHFRYLGQKDGTVNLKGALQKAGVKSPLELAYEKEKTTDIEVLRKKDEYKSLFYKDKKTGEYRVNDRNNNLNSTFTNLIVRENVEQMCLLHGYDLDNLRTKRKNLSVLEYKTQNRNKERHDFLDEQIKSEKHKHQEIVGRSYNQFKKEIEALYNSNFVLNGTVINDEYFESVNKKLEKSKFSQSKKDKIRQKFREIEQIMKETEINETALKNAQNYYEKLKEEQDKAKLEALEKTKQEIERAEKVKLDTKGEMSEGLKYLKKMAEQEYQEQQLEEQNKRFKILDFTK